MLQPGSPLALPHSLLVVCITFHSLDFIYYILLLSASSTRIKVSREQELCLFCALLKYRAFTSLLCSKPSTGVLCPQGVKVLTSPTGYLHKLPSPPCAHHGHSTWHPSPRLPQDLLFLYLLVLHISVTSCLPSQSVQIQLNPIHNTS